MREPSDAAPQVLLIAGANGTGKTTVAPRLMRELGIGVCLNADEIARGLSPADPAAAAVAAGREMHVRMEVLRERRTSFALETTLSGRSLLGRLRRLERAGYVSRLVFLWVPSADVAAERVRLRRALGGHGVPEEDIRRRHSRGVHNFERIYRLEVPFWRVYHGAAPRTFGRPPLIASGSAAIVRTVADRSAWLSLRVQAAQAMQGGGDER